MYPIAKLISRVSIILIFSAAVSSDSGISDIRKYVCLAHVARPNDGSLISWSTADNERENTWKFTKR